MFRSVTWKLTSLCGATTARSRDFLDETVEALAHAVFVAQAVEVRAAVRPLVQEETCNLRVALEGGNLVELALQRDAVCVGDEALVVLPDRKVAFDERLDVLDERLDVLLGLAAARACDVRRIGGQERVVPQGHEHLVVDVACHIFFFVLEVAVAKARIGNG